MVNLASDWRTTETTLDQRFNGTTTITALYGQGRLAPHARPVLTSQSGWRL